MQSHTAYFFFSPSPVNRSYQYNYGMVRTSFDPKSSFLKDLKLSGKAAVHELVGKTQDLPMFKRFFSILTTNLQSFKTKYVNKHAFLHNNASIIHLLSLLGIAQGRRRDVLKNTEIKIETTRTTFLHSS